MSNPFSKLMQTLGLVHPEIRHTCPRRLEDFGLRGRDADEDTWPVAEQFSGTPKHAACSYCGSIHPDVFMAMCRSGSFGGG